MVSDRVSRSPSSWLKDLLNGFLVWLIGFILYLIPGFIVAVPMGFNLGPKLKDNAEVGRQIGQAVSDMYQSSAYLHYGYFLVLALLVLWRSRVLSNRSSTKSITHGVLVATIPLILTAVPFALGGHIFISAIAVVVLLSAGIIGAIRKTPRTSPQ
jgi:hypothetical protein